MTSLSLSSELFVDYPVTPIVHPTLPTYCSASAERAQACSINSIARARTRSSVFSKARINGSTAPGGADCAQVSRARILVPTSGESRSLVIHVGTTRGFSEPSDSVDGANTVGRFSPIGMVSFPAAVPDKFPKVRDTGFGAGVNELLLGNGSCLGRNGVPTFARDPMFCVLSDEVCPQPASPVRSIRLRSITRFSRN